MAGSLVVVETDRHENDLPVSTIKDQWQVSYARFIAYPSLPSTCPSLVLLARKNHHRAPVGNWIATSLPAASLQIINGLSGSETILSVCLSEKILEEHYISKLHFSWPQVQCIPELPARGSRAVFVSYKDSDDEIQKFALRFSTLPEAESFMKALKENLKGEYDIEPLDRDFGSEFSTQSEFISSNGLASRGCKELSDMTPSDSYTPQIDPSLSYEIEQQSFDKDAMLSDNSKDNFPAMPPSFTSLLTDCYSTAKQAANQPTVSAEIDLKSQIMKYMEDSSFQGEATMYPFACSDDIKQCNALLYHVDSNIGKDQVGSYYSVDSSTFRPISHGNSKDFLIPVTCSCEDLGNGTKAYFYDATYNVQKDDTFFEVSARIYDGQALQLGGEEHNFNPGNKVTMHLLCGCIESQTKTIVTYTVQRNDTLINIASLLSSNVNDIQSLNGNLTKNPDDILTGWVLHVPMPNDRIPAAPKRGRRFKWTVLVVILSALTALSTIALLIILIWRKKSKRANEEDQKPVSKSISARAFSLQNPSLYTENMGDVTIIESERPVIYSQEEIEEATFSFDETKKIGSGGYGSVYFGVLGEKEVAVKKMRSNKSKEFFAELKVLCKVHHINVVELLGFASGDDHLYLVYEYVQYGSLSDHLHDPLLKGHQPLSWTARTQIALDAAKGIEYIHDHTKARYVHRDIKTSNILLDNGLRAKVADFGLAKLVERTNEEELIATRLVGTPGYLPPESVMELQVTPKTDVFAFGVVLAELITGQRALVRDNREPNKMKSLIVVINKVFEADDPESALKEVIDGNLRSSYPMEEVYKMAELAEWCLSDEAVSRPEMREVVVRLSQIVMSSVEWEASLGGNSQVFSGR
ncbi:hypothetical protein CCACVL1_14496 [Corchorus capsularis]|uniref:Protein kinase domain-containing protein n=1 Tax=Corchorus capsularis TaxID=210143 RepID=A0A1R3I6W9_COCAP|nr:hypothetical protein CCACVL1_14496 [Corchorus capsularis]